MKTLNKILAIFMAMSMLLAMTLTASAATTITVEDENNDAQYVGYRLLDLTTSPKIENPQTEEDYNYAYTINGKYRAALEAVTGKTADGDIIAYISDLDADGTRTFADAMYRAIGNGAVDATFDPKSAKVVAEGYWLIAEVSDELANGEAYSLVLLGTAGGTDFEVTPKKDAPEVDKVVQENSNGAWGDSAHYEIGDSVPFLLIGTLPNNLSSYETYQYIFHDELSAGLTYDGNAKVYLVDSVAADGTLVGATDITGSFTVSSDGMNLTIGSANILGITGIGANKKIVVTYTATLNAGAVIAEDANTNTVHLEYSNKPYEAGTGKTPETEVEVYTFELPIYKFTGELDADDVGLAGAGFTLRYGSETGDEIAFVDLGGGRYRVATASDLATVTEVFSPESGDIALIGLDAGTYHLAETTVPEGFNQAGPWIVVVEDDNIDGAWALTVDGDETETINIQNNTGSILPETGGIGTTIFTIVGIVLMAGAAVVLIAKKKTSAKG